MRMNTSSSSNLTGKAEKRGGWFYFRWERWQPRKKYWKLIGAGIAAVYTIYRMWLS
ncbi:MAG: hypothetical protein OEV49_03490 [candidate division Zixibacteria bacterium]|nr:hypothetical protein [candidate division Zixibacteria bacterium]MDH3939247.1 hypothetical protein [candidate division Zixibacteria bacterium]MDH4034649.1 hypothetical protein [candidate division Zixibacteria bacterium]